MTEVTFHLRAAGVLLLTLASVHVFFPRRFRWREELARLSTLNRQIFQVHVLFIVLILVMMLQAIGDQQTDAMIYYRSTIRGLP